MVQVLHLRVATDVLPHETPSIAGDVEGAPFKPAVGLSGQRAQPGDPDAYKPASSSNRIVI